MSLIFDISTSLDGYVTGPNPGPDNGLGDGGAPIHHWALEHQSPADTDILDRMVARTGAVLMGRNLFDVVDGPRGWDETMGYGADREDAGVGAAPPPCFVVTSAAPDHVRLAHRFTIVTDGIEAALARARAAAGDRDVVIMGGAALGRAYLDAGLVDELVIHLAPVLLGAGTPLFPERGTSPMALDPVDVVATAHATHLTYRPR